VNNTIDRSQLEKESRLMTNNPNELTIDNSVVMLIDHQPFVAIHVHSIDPGLMLNNVAALARAARDLGVPTVLTTVGAKGSILVDPIFKEIAAIFPDVTPIDRTSTHAWSHPEVRAAVDKTKRKKLIIAGAQGWLRRLLRQRLLGRRYVGVARGRQGAHGSSRRQADELVVGAERMGAGLYVGGTTDAPRSHPRAGRHRRDLGRLRIRAD
jgi:hypothetical protein